MHFFFCSISSSDSWSWMKPCFWILFFSSTSISCRNFRFASFKIRAASFRTISCFLFMFTLFGDFFISLRASINRSAHWAGKNCLSRNSVRTRYIIHDHKQHKQPKTMCYTYNGNGWLMYILYAIYNADSVSNFFVRMVDGDLLIRSRHICYVSLSDVVFPWSTQARLKSKHYWMSIKTMSESW